MIKVNIALLKGQGMDYNIPQVRVGTKVRFFPHSSREAWDTIIEVFDTSIQDPKGKGEGREYHASWLLSLFNCEVINVAPGSPLDLEGIDIILRTEKGDLLIQVKSSPCGVLNFIKKRPVTSEEILILWFDKNKVSRRKLFYLLVPILQAQGIELKKEVREALTIEKRLVEKHITTLPVLRKKEIRGLDIELLMRIGVVSQEGGYYLLC